MTAAVIYARISKDGAGEHLGVDRQERLCRDLADTAGLTVVDVLVDLVDLVEASGAQVRTVSAGSVDLTTASGRMVARMLGVAAQHEIGAHGRASPVGGGTGGLSAVLEGRPSLSR